MADGVDGLQIQWIIAVAVAKFFSIEDVLILLPAVEEIFVQVLLLDMLIVMNADATMGDVSKSVRKPTRDIPVHALKDINSVEVHVLVCDGRSQVSLALPRRERLLFDFGV